MTTSVDLDPYPLCAYFLSGFLSSADDDVNFPPDQPGLFQRYENVFASALAALGMTKESLRSKSEFNFDSGNPQNLEAGIAVLRAIEALRRENFVNIAFVKPKRGKRGADLVCCRAGEKVCCEVKAITKQSSGRQGLFFADQLYTKILEFVGDAREQLDATAQALSCTVKILICVCNWFDQSIYLDQDSYQKIVDRLEKDPLDEEGQFLESLRGIDAALFVTMTGAQHFFLHD